MSVDLLVREWLTFAWQQEAGAFGYVRQHSRTPIPAFVVDAALERAASDGVGEWVVFPGDTARHWRRVGRRAAA